jgi:hypothetical protein
MGTLIFICPGTRQTVSTGIEIDPASFSTLSRPTYLYAKRSVGWRDRRRSPGVLSDASIQAKIARGRVEPPALDPPRQVRSHAVG